MKFLFPLKTAYGALSKHKVRTALTVLGMVIGIGSVIMVMAAGEGIKNYVTDQISSFGTNIIQVEVKTPNVGKTSVENATSMAQGLSITTLTREDAEALSKLSYVDKVNVGLIGQEVFNYEGNTKTALIFGTDQNFLDVYNMVIGEGYFIDETHVDSQARVVVLGIGIKEKLFGESQAVGKNVKIRNKNYRVIGVLEEKGIYFGMDMDSVTMIPITTIQKQLMGVDHLSYAMSWLKDDSYIDRGIDEFTEILRTRHDIEERNPDKYDFSVTSMQEAMGMMDSILGGISLLLIAIASISLIVGGVGIMNIMYVSVSERTYEIGLRKAVGATSKNIMNQFLIEAGLITFGGAIVGVGVGALLAWLTAIIAQSQGIEWRFSLPPESVIISVGVAVAIGLIFGLYPAKEAAKLDPIDALRQN